MGRVCFCSFVILVQLNLPFMYIIYAEDQPHKPHLPVSHPAHLLYIPPLPLSPPNLFYYINFWYEVSSTQWLSVHFCAHECSVHPLSTVDGSTVTGDFMLIILQVKFVVIWQLKKRGRHVKTSIFDWLMNCWRTDRLPLLLSGCAYRSWWWSCSLSQQSPPPWCSWENMNG